MKIIERIDQDFKQAIKSQDANRVGVLRLLKSAIKNLAIEKRAELDDSDMIKILNSEVKKRKEAIEAYKKGERPDLVKKEEAELKILGEYLPEKLNREQIKSKIIEIRQQLPEADQDNFGQLMKAIMPAFNGQADGQQVADLVKEVIKD